MLEQADILVLKHPCDRRWERTTSTNSPQLSSEELADVLQFVENGGALVVVTEYEHDKYGDNLNELLAPCGLQIGNTTTTAINSSSGSTSFTGAPSRPSSARV